MNNVSFIKYAVPILLQDFPRKENYYSVHIAYHIEHASVQPPCQLIKGCHVSHINASCTKAPYQLGKTAHHRKLMD